MKKLLLLIAICVPILLSGQTKSTKSSTSFTQAEPESVGMSSERLDRIDAMCNEVVKNGSIPGAVALIVRNGKIVLHEAYGIADAETGRKMEKHALFRLASQTKAITATAVMMLWEEGKFRLDDPISIYIPEFKEVGILNEFDQSDSSFTSSPAKRKIRIRDLLTHTSGIGYGAIDGDERMKMIYAKAGITEGLSNKNITIEDNIKLLAKLPLHQEPGEKFLYGMGLDVLGYFVEIVSGMPFDKFLEERLFKPLKMNNIGFYFPEYETKRLVKVLTQKDGEWVNMPNDSGLDYPVRGAKRLFAGGAGLTGTIQDYATFLQMYLNGGELNGVRILSPTTIAIIMGNSYPDVFNENFYYGLAFGMTTEVAAARGGKGSESTFDWGGYFNTQYFADPKEQVIGLIFKQTLGPVDDPTGWKFRQMVFAAIDD